MGHHGHNTMQTRPPIKFFEKKIYCMEKMIKKEIFSYENKLYFLICDMKIITAPWL